MGPGFRLYNVSGLDAVELRLKTGDIRAAWAPMILKGLPPL
jgi:hypothetical protein